MPGPMPYYFEKGPALSILEAYINDSPHSEIVNAVTKLRAKNPNGSWTYRVTDCGAFTNTKSFDVRLPGQNTTMTGDIWVQHINEHWFGLVDSAGKPVNPKVAHINAASSWWINYWGDDVEGIVRETFVRSIETAYRVPHGAALPSTTTPWPVELFWKCGQAWFEGWVTWRRVGANNGLVTAMFATPAENTGRHFLWWSPEPDPLDTAGRSDPWNLGAGHLGLERQGMVVVSHTTNLPIGRTAADIDEQMAGKLQPPPPSAVFHGSGDITVVRPSERRGGVASTPKTWKRNS